MNETMMSFLAQSNFDWLDNVLGIVVVAFVVIGNVANSIIKSIKEKKEREKKLTTPMPKSPTAHQRGHEPSVFPTARPRQSHPEVATPRPPPRPAPPQRPVTRPAPEAEPPQPAKTLGIPRELLPEGLGEILAEIAPELVRPKPRPQAPPAQRPPARMTREASSRRRRPAPPPEPAKKSESERVHDSAQRLGTLTSSFDDEASSGSSVGAHVDAHISHLEHPVDDAPIGTSAHARRLPSRAALRHAIIMSEIIAKPRALRPIDDQF